MSTDGNEPETPPTPPPMEPVPTAQRDPNAVLWWTIEALNRGAIDVREAQVYLAAVRASRGLPPSPGDADRVRQESILHGRIWHGIPPETEGQWALAAEVFDDEGLAELRSWTNYFSLDGDAEDRVELLPLFEDGADEAGAAGFDDDDGGLA